MIRQQHHRLDHKWVLPTARGDAFPQQFPRTRITKKRRALVSNERKEKCSPGNVCPTIFRHLRIISSARTGERSAEEPTMPTRVDRRPPRLFSGPYRAPSRSFGSRRVRSAARTMLLLRMARLAAVRTNRLTQIRERSAEEPLTPTRVENVFPRLFSGPYRAPSRSFGLRRVRSAARMMLLLRMARLAAVRTTRRGGIPTRWKPIAPFHVPP